MAKIKPVARYVLKRREHRVLIAQLLSGEIDWKDGRLKPLKDAVRELLRKEQDEVCPYCQRIIIPERRNLNEHIEHILDKSKSKYKKFSLTSSNLILACQGCNVEKGQKDLLGTGAPAPTHLHVDGLPFIWPHPYKDDMLECVRKDQGPVYSPIVGSGREAQAVKMIQDLKLNDTRNIESRHGRLEDRRNRLTNILGRLAEKDDDKSRRRMRPLIIALTKVNDELS